MYFLPGERRSRFILPCLTDVKNEVHNWCQSPDGPVPNHKRFDGHSPSESDERPMKIVRHLRCIVASTRVHAAIDALALIEQAYHELRSDSPFLVCLVIYT